MKKPLLPTLLFVLIFTMIYSCKDSNVDILNNVENIIQETPDSALIILKKINKEKLRSNSTKAKYALYMSMALDKNYIDTTTFDVIQPAIDYYLKNGSPDEKFRTYYYEGRIYQNMGEEEEAMKVFIKALDLKNMVKDSLTLANLLVAQAVIYHNQYKINEFINNNLTASDIYKAIGKHNFQIKSLSNALNGYITKGNKPSADSLMTKSAELVQRYSTGESTLFTSTLAYLLKFGTHHEIEIFLENYKNRELSEDDAINFALGYTKIGENQKAFSYLSSIEQTGTLIDSLKLASVKVEILTNAKKYKEALEEYKKFSYLAEKNQYKLLSQDILFADKRHEIEKENLIQIQKKDKIIWLSISIGFLLFIIIMYIYYRLKLGEVNSRLINEEKQILLLESENLKNENKSLELEKHNALLEKQKAELEFEQQTLVAENLKHRINELENESSSLKEILKKQKDLSKPIEEAIKIRIEMLNGLLASQITENDSYSQPYGSWIEEVLKDKNEFMNSTRLAFKASHPKFIEYLEQHGLSTSEINYICLYAIGLRGKEVGEYMQLKRHYHISSDIRKKLGIDEHQTNIGIYVRKLMKKL